MSRLFNKNVHGEPKLCFETKSTKLGIGHFTSISSQFFAKYINRFHKTEVLTVILKGLTCQNLNWIKSYSINHDSFHFILFSICKKKAGNLQLINGNFTTIFGHFFGNYINIFHKTEIKTIILRSLLSQNLV